MDGKKESNNNVPDISLKDPRSERRLSSRNERRREMYAAKRKILDQSSGSHSLKSKRISQIQADWCSDTSCPTEELPTLDDVMPNPFHLSDEATLYNTDVIGLKMQPVLTESCVLNPPTICCFCGAKKFYRESNGLCCSSGKIKLRNNSLPDELFQLYTSSTDESLHFRTICRSYNNHFAFTSFGVKYDKDLCRMNKGIYTFRVQGQIYHFINNLVPIDGKPSFLQLYFFDTEHELQNRLQNSCKFSEQLLQKLMDILRINPYAKFFRSLNSIEALETYKIQIRCDPGLDQRVFNMPSISQVAAVWVDEDPNTDVHIRDISIYSHFGQAHKVHYYFGCYDPLQYPLLFPFGEPGWHEGIEYFDMRKSNLSIINENVNDIHSAHSATEFIEKENAGLKKNRKRLTVSCREYYCYKLHIRNTGNSILHAGRLLQQYIVDMYVKIETSRLDYFRNNQTHIRAELYQGIVDSVEMGETRSSNIGRKIVLPSSFTGGPRDNKKRYMDAMSLVQHFGKPDIFLTMTCNPNWPEIKQELCHADKSQNRPDLIARIFRSKLEELKNDLFKKHIFGTVVAYIYVIEFQKRGLPHSHFLLILNKSSKNNCTSLIDQIVSCEIPSESDFPYLRSRVIKHMMHGPCGSLNPDNICMQQDKTCKNKFPREFVMNTTINDSSYPIYRRRNTGECAKVRGSILDNRWVVPYNPYLLSKYDCHINVEICSTIKVVKYLYKYVYKGHDRINFSINTNGKDIEYDEISRYQTARWISPPEAAWRIYGFLLAENFPAVISLQLHLEDCQLVTFRNYESLPSVISKDYVQRTMLTEFFRMNIYDELARTILYRDFPIHFVWNSQGRVWTRRKQKHVIGRIVTANPTEGERYYLRILLNHIRGPTSFSSLKRVNDLQVATFREAVLLHGLLNEDNSCELCLAEAITYQMPTSLRRLFATILLLCSPNNPNSLWEKFKTYMFEDYMRDGLSYNDAELKAELKALKYISSLLEPLGKNINDYKFVPYDINVEESERLSNMISEEMRYSVANIDANQEMLLNQHKKQAYDIVLENVFSNKNSMFFIDGPGGTGKTFLYKKLLLAVRSRNYIALAVASSGVAASLLPGGRTAHSKFKISLESTNETNFSISKQSALADLLRMTKLIIWDEAPMINRFAIEALDKVLQDINDSNLPFGGKVIVLGGDFRQILPVVPRGTKADIIKSSLVFSYLWPLFTKLSLVKNMRAHLDISYSNYLLDIGNGLEVTHSCDMIALPSEITIPYKDELVSLNELINIVFPNLHNYTDNLDTMINRVILTPKNECVDQINTMLLKQIPGETFMYYSFDESIDKTEQSIQEDFLNTLTPNGIPPHELTLKKNCPIMLLRNINPAEGLCNGTRLVCKNFGRNVIDVEIAIGEHLGKRVFLPRIPFIPLEGDKNSIPFKRTQFPIRPCFAMTINKAQGQTLDFVGLYLPDPVFSHGQLYVALSRARTSKCIKILIKPVALNSASLHSLCTKNVVYREILDLVH